MPACDILKRILLITAICLLSFNCQAVILYSGDNSLNQTAPDAERLDIFNSVARVSNSDGSGSFGSATHIRGKYLLTANHVANRSHVTFDGVSYHARDTSFTPRRIGAADLKLIKLVEDPLLPEVNLNTSSTDILSTATLVGWGVGRDPNAADSGLGQTNIWKWSNSSTFAKRWGTNRIESVIPANTFPFNFSYEAISTTLDTNITGGSNEAAAAIYDSGSGLFIEVDGTWVLAGITTAVTLRNPSASTFAFSNGDQNFFVRINALASAIEAEIPDLTTLSEWKIDHSLYGADADNNADTDLDGISQLLEFALGGDPNVSDISIQPTHTLTEDGGNTYVELTITRPKNLQGITYTPLTATDLSSWPSDSTGIVDDTPTPSDNGNGTETLIYRRGQAVAGTGQAFIRIEVSEN
ncbi:MAG: hypothetical protein ACI9ZV_000803 [Candidatus Azotimanducaceae bacterium]